ncbi:Methionine--tRNA ligase [Nosema granulosis]|uniref:Methionine--tRNA ligase n=1 Tax=Nosema granulosis TaxID=83296 RepID=A0A9P6H0C2_9MICR|nr:Methionine--tRNA ligase [Nosema granulosis]
MEKLHISKEYEDIKFAVQFLDPEMEIISCEDGIYISDKDTDDFDDVATLLLKKYQPSKTLKDLKKIRKGLDQQPCEKQFLSLISYYNHFKNLSNNLKYSKYVEELTKVYNLQYLYFYILKIQVGLVTEAKEVEGSDKLFLETVEFGDKSIQIVSGVRPYISKEDFVGKKFLFLTNIKPGKVMGIESCGMILCGKEGEKVCVIKVGDDIPSGTLLELEKPSIVSDFEVAKMDLKKNFFSNIFKGLKIVGGFIEFEGLKAVLKSTPMKTEIENGTIS